MIPLLQRLESDEYDLIMSYAESIDIKKGTPIYHEGDPANNLYFIQKGKIKTVKNMGKDKEITLFTRGEEDCFGELGIFSGSKYTNTAIALESCRLFVLGKGKIEKLIEENGKLGLEFTRWVTESLETSKAKMRDYIIFGSEGAVAAVFVRYSNMYGIVTTEGIRITEPIMLRDVSKHIGISRETVSRVVNKWKADGIVSNDNKFFLINDISYFQKLLLCESCAVENCTL